MNENETLLEKVAEAVEHCDNPVTLYGFSAQLRALQQQAEEKVRTLLEPLKALMAAKSAVKKTAIPAPKKEEKIDGYQE